MRWPGLSLVIIYFLCVYMLLLHSLVLSNLCPFSLLTVFLLFPREVGYRATRVFDSGYITMVSPSINFIPLQCVKDKAVPLQALSDPDSPQIS